jgi:hypothetical protein
MLSDIPVSSASLSFVSSFIPFLGSIEKHDSLVVLGSIEKHDSLVVFFFMV